MAWFDCRPDCYPVECTLKPKDCYEWQSPCLRLIDSWPREHWVSWLSTVVKLLIDIMWKQPLVKSKREFSLCRKFVLHDYSLSSRITKKKKFKIKRGRKRKSKPSQREEWLKRVKPPYASLRGESGSRKKFFFSCVNHRRKNGKWNNPSKVNSETKEKMLSTIHSCQISPDKLKSINKH